MKTLNCIACGNIAHVTSSITGSEISRALDDYFQVTTAASLELRDYEMVSCSHCSIEFANPMLPGSDDFYKWITSQPNYYPSDRWEFSQVIDIIKKAAKSGPITVLDVGCGGGDFLTRLKGHAHIDLQGLDTTPQSVDACIAKGLNAHCCTTEEFSQRYPEQRFDFVVSFHCIEHVPNPRVLISEMSNLLKTTGELLISAPLSPMSFETSWFDPLNHPPHHLTRFSAKALFELARTTGLKLSLTSSPAGDIKRVAKRTLWLKEYGPHKPVKRLSFPLMLMTNPLSYFEELRRQKKRIKDAEGFPGDTFLARYSF